MRQSSATSRKPTVSKHAAMILLCPKHLAERLADQYEAHELAHEENLALTCLPLPIPTTASELNKIVAAEKRLAKVAGGQPRGMNSIYRRWALDNRLFLNKFQASHVLLSIIEVHSEFLVVM